MKGSQKAERVESMRYWTRDREAGNKIESFGTLEEAQKAIKAYEESDKREGIYEPDFYEVYEEEEPGSILNAFINRVNKGNEWRNATLYSDCFYQNAHTEKVTFERRHREYYNQLLVFCAENNLTIVATNPATFATVVRIENNI